MDFPPLRSLDLLGNPGGPRWADARLNQSEIESLLRRLVMIVAFDDRAGRSVVLGSGFLIGTDPDLLALSATHIFTEWADRVRPPAPHALRGLHGDGDDLRDRLAELIHKNWIRAIVHCKPPGEYRLCKLAALTVSADPRDLDVACLRLARPKNTTAADFDALMVDVDHYDWSEHVLMAGYVGGAWTPPETEDEPFRLEQSLVFRVGYCRGLIGPARDFRSGMYQVNIPSLAGMSGGPMLALRYPHGRPRIMSSQPHIYPTAIGVVSRECMASPTLLDGSDADETWVSPIEDSYLLRLAWSNRPTVFFGDAVKEGRIRSYGQRARTADVRATGDGTRLEVRFGLPSTWRTEYT